MTTTSAPSAPPVTSARSIGWPVAVGAVAFAVALNALGIWGDGTPDGEDSPLLSFLVVCGFIGVAAVLVFGLFVPRGLKRLAATDRAGVGAVVMSCLALVFVVAFWTGLPPILAAGGIVLGHAGRTAARRSGLGTAATVIGILALVADVAIYVSDWLSTNGMI